MPITSAPQFEAILSRIMSKIDKELIERPACEPLKEAKRVLDKVNSFSRDAAKLKAHKDALMNAGEQLRSQIPRDPELEEQTWDLIDYIDYQLS